MLTRKLLRCIPVERLEKGSHCDLRSQVSDKAQIVRYRHHWLVNQTRPICEFLVRFSVQSPSFTQRGSLAE